MLVSWTLKYLHIIGAAALLELASASRSLCCSRIRPANPAIITAVVRIVVIADFLFTATTVVSQPLTGALFAWEMGFLLKERRIAASIFLYLGAGAFWFPSSGCNQHARPGCPQHRARNLLADDGEASALVTAIALQSPSECAIYTGTVRRR